MLSPARHATTRRQSDLPAAVELLGLARQPSRLHISRGTALASELGFAADRFKPTARVPIPEWTSPAPAELVSLLGSAGSDDQPSPFIAVIRPPDALIRELEPIQDRLPDQQRVATVANELVSLYAEAAAPYRCQGVGRTLSNLITTTRGSDGRHIGLHVDSWYCTLPSQCRSAPNRLSLNLSREKRSLLAINLPLDDIENQLQEIGLGNYGRNTTGLCQDFMAHVPDYPVIAVDVFPGEAYIAPTEAIIHDGSTIGNQHPDIFLTILGRFLRPGGKA